MTDAEADRLWAVVAAAGHGPCGGWQYDEHTGQLTCACGARLFQAAQEAVT